MKFKRFFIEGYRAVERAEVAVSNNLIPVIGINESGKTSILLAILAFDKNNDRYNRGAHLIHKNKYEIKEKEGKISAEIKIDSDDDVEYISDKLNLTAADPLYKELQLIVKNDTSIKLSRTFPDKRYHVENSSLQIGSATQQRNLAIAIYDRLPLILYFDDFSDRVPEKIEFPLDDESEKGYKIPTSGGEWNLILEEVFKRATKEKISLSEFLQIKDEDSQEGVISDIQDKLHEEVVEDWKNLKKRYGTGFGEENFGDKPEDLKLKLAWKISDDKNKITFKFQVLDRTTGQSRPFNIGQRSKGFQWFFNFIMKLKFNPKYQDNQEGAIYLLDEPGSYLHTSAQEELLKKLQEISNTNTILYCTHSQYLLSPDVINISRIRIAEKEKGVIKVLPYGSACEILNSGAFTPLYQALRIKSGFFNKDIKYPVITEGITDFYLFDLLKKHKKDYFDKKVDFIAGAGADQLKDLISHAIAFSNDYRVLLDSDDKGIKARDKYRDFFGETEAKKFFNYNLTRKQEAVELEDHLSSANKKHLTKLTGVEDTKAALPVLYYSKPEVQKEFVDNLDDITLKNLGVVQGKVNSMVNKKKEQINS